MPTATVLRETLGLGILNPRVITAAERMREVYSTARPFRHVWLDDFLSEGALARTLARFAPAADPAGKRGASSVCSLRTPLAVTHRLHSDLVAPDFFRLITQLTGEQRLLTRPDGAQASLVVRRPGAATPPHIDRAMREPGQGTRRLKLVIFLNVGWQPVCGGSFDLYDDPRHAPAVSLDPICNRAILHEVSQTSWTGRSRIGASDHGAVQDQREIVIYFSVAATEKPVAALRRIFTRPPRQTDAGTRGEPDAVQLQSPSRSQASKSSAGLAADETAVGTRHSGSAAVSSLSGAVPGLRVRSGYETGTAGSPRTSRPDVRRPAGETGLAQPMGYPREAADAAPGSGHRSGPPQQRTDAPAAPVRATLRSWWAALGRRAAAAEIGGLRAALGERERAFADAAAHADDLKAQLREAQYGRDAATAALSRSEAEARQRDAALAEAARQIEDLRRSVSERDLRIGQLTTESLQQLAERDALTAALRRREEEGGENAALLSAAQAERDSLRTALFAAEERAGAIAMRLGDGETRIKKLSADLRQTADERDVVAAALGRSEQAARENAAGLSAAQAERDALQAALIEAEERVGAALSRLVSLRKDLAARNTALIEAEERAEAIVARLADSEARFGQLAAEWNRISAENAALKRSNQKARDKAAGLAPARVESDGLQGDLTTGRAKPGPHPQRHRPMAWTGSAAAVGIVGFIETASRSR